MTARDHVPLRSRASSRSASSISSYAHRLTRRDFDILVELYEHRVLTTPQIYQLHFETHTRASKRMLQLYRLGLVERFRPTPPPVRTVALHARRTGGPVGRGTPGDRLREVPVQEGPDL